MWTRSARYERMAETRTRNLSGTSAHDSAAIAAATRREMRTLPRVFFGFRNFTRVVVTRKPLRLAAVSRILID
jgi:hypothetical protein